MDLEKPGRGRMANWRRGRPILGMGPPLSTLLYAELQQDQFKRIQVNTNPNECTAGTKFNEQILDRDWLMATPAFTPEEQVAQHWDVIEPTESIATGRAT